jgi:hypothetical protein
MNENVHHPRLDPHLFVAPCEEVARRGNRPLSGYETVLMQGVRAHRTSVLHGSMAYHRQVPEMTPIDDFFRDPGTLGSP